MPRVIIPKKPKRNVTALELPATTRASLKQIKREYGLNYTASIARGVKLLQIQLGGVV